MQIYSIFIMIKNCKLKMKEIPKYSVLNIIAFLFNSVGRI